jgi:hypothetical protein
MAIEIKTAKTSLLAVAALLALSAPALAAGRPASLSLSCTGNSYKHDDPFPAPETVALKTSGKGSVTVNIGQGGADNARVLSNNAYQLRFAAGKFTGEYFHLTGDLFLIHSDGRLIKLACKQE